MSVRWSASNLTTPGGQTAIALPAALALTGLVTVVVAYFAGSADDAGSVLLAEIGAGAFVLFGLVTAWVASRTRAKVTLQWNGDALQLDVEPPRKPRATYVGPFREEHGYVREAVHTGRASIPQLVLVLAVFETKSGRCVLLLRELLGAAYDPPPGWVERTVVVRGAEHVLVNSIGRLELEQLAKALA